VKESRPKGKMAQTPGPFTYIIVGAGSAGCVLANRLSADPRNSVALLEAGGHGNYLWVHIPVGYLYCMGNPKMDWRFKTEPEAGLNGRAINYPRGRLLGGCSAINGMIYMRGQAADYDHWRQLGLSGWGWQDVLPYFLKSEDNGRGSDAMHHAGGEWRVEEQRLHWPILDAVQDACEEVGIPRTRDFNRGDNFGTGYFQVNQRRGIRVTTAKAFLDPIRSRKNLAIFTNAQVKRIVFEGRRAVGVAFERDGEEIILRAAREVISSAGAIGSPHILQLSGVGDAEALSRHGIATVLNRPAIGANLQDHLQLRLIYKITNAVTLNQRANSLWGRAMIGAEYALNRSGPMSMAPSQLGIFAKSDPSFATANLEYHVQPLSLDKFGQPLHRFPAVTMSVCNLRPQSRGHVGLRSADYRDPPMIQPNYLSTETDRLVAADAIRLTRRIMATKALAKHTPSEYLPGAQYQSDDQLAEAAGHIGTTIFHPAGTCRMGVDDDAPVDGALRVRGLSGLRVVDASVMPTITSGNTNAPTVMIAEKASDLILAEQRESAAA
jgi:choline dehydrogenase